MPSLSLSQSFGLVIRKRRLKSGKTQESLADSAGLHPTYIGLIERGRRNPTLDVCVRLAAALEVPIEILVGEAAKGVEARKR